MNFHINQKITCIQLKIENQFNRNSSCSNNIFCIYQIAFKFPTSLARSFENKFGRILSMPYLWKRMWPSDAPCPFEIFVFNQKLFHIKFCC